MKRLDYYWNDINFISLLLLPLSVFFCFISKIRSIFYKLNLFKSYKAPVPVIVVGNITVGGTGKTPLIIELVKQLKKLGKKPGVISRGYGGQSEIWPVLVNETTNAKLVGDEPQLIFDQLNCPVVVGANRKDDIELLIRESDCDVVLSDDGLQHYALQRDLEIVVVDAQRGFGNGFCLPSGPLRENVNRLKDVDLVLLNGGSENEHAFIMQPTKCESIGFNADPVDLKNFSGKTVHAIAGIGNPDRFFKMLEEFDVNVIKHGFEDHYFYTKSDINFNDDLSVLMTEKDAVKCKKYELSDHWSVPVEILLTQSAQKKLNHLLDSLV